MAQDSAEYKGTKKKNKKKKQRCDTDTPFRVNSKLIGEHLATNQISQPPYQLVRRDQMKANAFVPGRIMYSQRSRFKIQFFSLRSLNRFSKPFGARSPSPQLVPSFTFTSTPHHTHIAALHVFLNFFFFFESGFCKCMQIMIVQHLWQAYQSLLTIQGLGIREEHLKVRNSWENDVNLSEPIKLRPPGRCLLWKGIRTIIRCVKSTQSAFCRRQCLWLLQNGLVSIRSLFFN